MHVKIGNFRTELVDYAKEAANKVATSTNTYVSNVERLVKQADKGKKFWGIPYAPRPSYTKVEKAVQRARSQLAEVLIRDIKAGAKGEAKGGKGYLVRARGDLEAIQGSLESAGSLTDAEGQYLAETKDRINENLSKVNSLWDGYLEKIESKKTDALAKAEKSKLARAARESQAELNKLTKEREQDFEKHLKELKKRKW